MGPSLSLSDRVLAWFVSWAGWAIIQFVGRTSRIRVVLSPDYRDRRQKGLPVIYAFWHRYQVLMVYERRGSGVRILVSRSRDGEFIARTLRRFGFETARGSSSRGGAGAFLKLAEALRAGTSVAFTPDGPRGPLRSVRPGVLALAVKSGVPVVPLAWAGTRAKELKSWDRFLVPKPFGRYAVVYGQPVVFKDEGPEAEQKLRTLLNAAEEEALLQLAGINNKGKNLPSPPASPDPLP